MNKFQGIVVALQANFLEVELDKGLGVLPVRLLCTCRTRLRHKGLAVHVGDRVLLEEIDLIHKRAVIAEVEPRSSWLERPAVANVSLIVVALAVDQPAFDPNQASRFLITAECTGIAIEILLTKCDLLPEKTVELLRARLQGWGYDPVPISSRNGDGFDILKKRFIDTSIVVFCGPSGAGKTSLINYLLPDLALRIGSVSGRLRRGRHTTRNVELFTLADGVRVADTPGFNCPDMPNDLVQFSLLFPELRCQLDPWPCRFRNCLHRSEPGCGVKRDWDRYKIYINGLDELFRINRSYRAS